MKKDTKAKEELLDLSPFLAGLDTKESKKEVPRDFFEQLPDNVMQQIKLEDQHLAAERTVQKSGWLSWLFPTRQPRYALAFATVLMLVVAAIFMIWPAEQQDSTLADKELSAEDWESYVNQNIDEFDSELLWKVSESTQTSETAVDESDDVLDDLLEDLNEEDLEEFFM